MPLPHHAAALHRHWLRRQTIFLLLLTLHKSFVMQRIFSLLLLLLSPVCTIFYAQKNDPAGLYPFASPWLDEVLRQPFITPCRGLRHHPAVLHWPCYVTTSECQALCSATSGPAWGMEPCPASSSDRVINTEHISQLSCLHAQSFKFLIVFGSAKHYTFLEKKLLVKFFLVQTLFVTHKFIYPVYLGAPLLELFLLHMIILVRLHFLFVYYATICTMLTKVFRKLGCLAPVLTPTFPIVRLGSKGSTSAIVTIGSTEPDLTLGEAKS